ncbi:MAG: hypothetical protein HC896_17465 [Bacteroidales bacterium]|nr:hypothetical protein [Bacteroidales bacterium]
MYDPGDPKNSSRGGWEDYYGNDKEDYNLGKDLEGSINSAPLYLYFYADSSKNAAVYHYFFSDDKTDTVYHELDSVFHVFRIPSAEPYQVKLITYSEEGCIDEDSVKIKVGKSEILAPKYITPNFDGQNDVFRVYDVSIADFEITI